jgi:anti-sigma factor (TIGR02949 family)
MGDDCRQIVEHLEVYLDGECPGDVEVVLRAHLELCPPCLDRADFERHLRVLMASRCRDVAPAGLLERILTALQDDRVAAPAPPPLPGHASVQPR